MTERPHLHALADRLGLVSSYDDLEGRSHPLDERTCQTLVAALGHSAENETRAAERIATLDDAKQRALIPPLAITRRGAIDEAPIEVRVETGAARIRWTLELRTEDREHKVKHGTLHPRGEQKRRRFALPRPWQPEPGEHDLTLTVQTGNQRWRAEQRWIVVPQRCVQVQDKLPSEGGFGLAVNLYTVRSRHNWGCGDFTDLAQLAQRAARHGADFVQLSPLHLLANRGHDVSPYMPVSRLFYNPIYLDVEAVPELASCTETRAWLDRPPVRRRIASLRAAGEVDYDGVAALKWQAMRHLHRHFVDRDRDHDTPRGRAYEAFRHGRGAVLDRLAIYQAADALLHEADGCTSWRTWPDALRDADPHALETFVRNHPELVDFHRYLQFETERQLAEAARSARTAGMALGLVHDLAIGSAPDGFDTWAFRHLFVDRVGLGCPPDPMSDEGQHWSLPPLHPRQLRNDDFRFWRAVLRSGMRHGGGLRIDHVLGLVRQFWIPDGVPASAGAYVQMPHDALFGLLALESHRSGAVIVGEDLGTVPEGMAERLEQWGVLSTRVLLFEQQDGAFKPSQEIGRRALVMATTHDLPTLAGWWLGGDLNLRMRLGLLDDDALAAARAHRQRDRHALLLRLAEEGLVAVDAATPPFGEVALAIHTFLARTPAPLVAVWLEDLLGETRPVNLPGVGPAQFAGWRRRLATGIEQAFADPGARQMLIAARRPRPATTPDIAAPALP